MLNRAFFPCFDTPAVKYTYSALIEVRGDGGPAPGTGNRPSCLGGRVSVHRLWHASCLKIPPPTEMLSAKPISSLRLVFGRRRPPAHCHRCAGRRWQPSAGGFLCCQVPDGFTAVMSADTWETRGPNTFFFQMSQPIPSYLVALAIGDLVSAEVGPR